MWIARLTQAVTVLAFVSTVTLVVAFLLAVQGIALAFFMGTIGGYLFPIPFALILATYLLRSSAGVMMIRRGHHRAALDYCLPRRAISMSVGRNEAAINRFAAAEAHRHLGAPEKALRLLDEPHKAPWRQDMQQLLAISRAQTLLDLNRRKEARAVLDALSQVKIARPARADISAARARLDAA